MKPDQAIDFAIDAWEAVGFDVDALPHSLKVMSLIGRINLEVILGGVYGWLINMGEYGPDTADAFESVGAHRCAAIVRKIIAPFPGSTPARDDRERVRQMETIGESGERSWRDLGNQLLAWPDDIQTLLQQFINKHEADFT